MKLCSVTSANFEVSRTIVMCQALVYTHAWAVNEYLEFRLQANCVVSDNIGGREATYDVCGATHKSGKTLTATFAHFYSRE